MYITLQEFPGICDHDEGLEADVSRDVLYFFNNGSAVIRKKEGEPIFLLIIFNFRWGIPTGDYF